MEIKKLALVKSTRPAAGQTVTQYTKFGVGDRVYGIEFLAQGACRDKWEGEVVRVEVRQGVELYDVKWNLSEGLPRGADFGLLLKDS